MNSTDAYEGERQEGNNSKVMIQNFKLYVSVLWLSWVFCRKGRVRMYVYMRIHVSVSVNMCEEAGDLPQVSFTFISIYFIFLKTVPHFIWNLQIRTGWLNSKPQDLCPSQPTRLGLPVRAAISPPQALGCKHRSLHWRSCHSHPIIGVCLLGV